MAGAFLFLSLFQFHSLFPGLLFSLLGDSPKAFFSFTLLDLASNGCHKAIGNGTEYLDGKELEEKTNE